VPPEALAMIAELQAGRAMLEATLAVATEERDRYKELYVKQLELCRKLELGILGQKSERFVAEGQLTLSLLGMLLGEAEQKLRIRSTDPVRHAKW
jgi:hypothetical protein